MNVTFLIGNGFDLNLGLKTKYTDFYPTYITNSKKLPESSCIRKFSEQIEENYKNWSDFEWALGQYADGTTLEVGQIIADFDNSFAEFLKIQCDMCNYTNSAINNELKKFILTPYIYLERRDKLWFTEYYNGHKRENINYSFISFNYTDTLDRMLSQEFRNNVFTSEKIGNTIYSRTTDSVLHIHGSLKENYIIVGIDSFEQFEKENMKSNNGLGRHCIKSIINNESGYAEKEERFKTIIESSNIVCAYGVSFGETDKSRWNIINKWLKNNCGNKLIVFQCNLEFSNLDGMSKGLLLDAIDDAKNEYLIRLGFEQKDFETMQKQIFVADSSKALKIKLIQDNDNSQGATNEAMAGVS